MALGRRKKVRQETFWIPTGELPRSEGHVFYRKLHSLLKEAEFDTFVEDLCEPHYAAGRGRPSIPPGTYFRMLLVGYFEGIGSQRGIAWRCADSLSLREFLGVALTENTPDHSSLTRLRDRLPLEIHAAAFQFVLQVAETKGLLKGKTIAIDATTLEANAAMKSIVRRDTGEDYNEYLKRLMCESGEIEDDEDPPADAMARFDRKRKDKKVSNRQWTSETDPDSRITKMKDGRTHLAYKAEHAVDLDSDLVLAASVYHADETDSETIQSTLTETQDHLIAIESAASPKEVVGDKGYYKHETIGELEYADGIRTYISEPKQQGRYLSKTKPDEQRRAVRNNRRRIEGTRGRRLQRKRSEMVERSFAHVCGTGGARRTHLRGIGKVRKRHLIAAAAHNLGVIMRELFGFGTPRALQGLRGLAVAFCLALFHMFGRFAHQFVPTASSRVSGAPHNKDHHSQSPRYSWQLEVAFSTDC
jgi:transposase